LISESNAGTLTPAEDIEYGALLEAEVIADYTLCLNFGTDTLTIKAP